jgi:two-component system sensor kinase FixL
MELSVGESWIGERRFFTGFARDMTEYHGAKQRLQELESELLHVSRLSAMGQMASTLAHELNQPLSAIANYVKASHRMLDSIDDPRRGRIQEVMTKASEQTIRAGEIVRRLRDYVEKRQTQRTWENLNKVVEEALALGLIGAAETNVKVRATLDPGLPLVAIDKVQIQQVLINLIRNAVEAMQTSPTRVLSITTRPDESEFVQVAIADTGVGLDDDVAAKLFQPFVTTKKAGMGVGLTICQSIIEGHGGRIWAVANESEGVTFRFRLPARKPNQPG